MKSQIHEHQKNSFTRVSKSIKHISFAIVLAVTTILSSCTSDGGTGGGGSAALGTLKAKAGSTNFTSMSAATFAHRSGTTIIIQGSDATGKAIQLMIMGASDTPATYQISDTSTIMTSASYTEINTSTFTSTTWAAPYDGSGDVGTIVITEITDTNVKGTFSFTGKNQSGSDTKNVSNGAFNVNFSS